MIGSVGHHASIHSLFQSPHAKAATPTLANPSASSNDSDEDVPSVDAGDDGSVGASQATFSPLSSSTLSSLLGLQMVDGQAQGGASGAQLNLPQITLPSGMDPSALLNGPTLLALQSIGA